MILPWESLPTNKVSVFCVPLGDTRAISPGSTFASRRLFCPRVFNFAFWGYPNEGVPDVPFAPY